MLAPAIRRNPSRVQRGVPKSVPAPVKGWNDRDPLADMDPANAVILDNFFPKPSYVELRSGSTNYATGITGTVQSIMPYMKTNGTQKIFAAAGTNIYDATSSGAVGAAVVTGLTSGQWQSSGFSTPGGNYIYNVNGVDNPQLYDGTTWTAITGASVPAITGVTPSTLIHVNAWKQRLFFVEASSTRCWYLPVNSVGGAANVLDFGSLFTLGGYLMAMATWTLDAGQGADDYAVFVSSEGEVLVFAGTDPSSSTTWAMRGRYVVGRPLGRRCFQKYAGDLVLVCQDGLIPLSKALMSSRVNTKIAMTDAIQNTTSEATSTYASNFGWEVQIFPPENMLILNVPVTGSSVQYVMNTITGAWCRFTGWNAQCFAVVGNALYYGDVGKTVQVLTGTADQGANINAEALQAFNYFGARSSEKLFKQARPIVAINNAVGLLIGVNTDFDETAPTGTPSFSPSTSALWDSALWGTGLWAAGLEVRKNWQKAVGKGYCAAMHMKIASNVSQMRWMSTDYIYEQGGLVGA